MQNLVCAVIISCLSCIFVPCASAIYFTVNTQSCITCKASRHDQCVSSVFASPSCSDVSYILSLCLCHVCQNTNTRVKFSYSLYTTHGGHPILVHTSLRSIVMRRRPRFRWMMRKLMRMQLIAQLDDLCHPRLQRNIVLCYANENDDEGGCGLRQ